jgi:uncharacterized protein (TIGR02594 family)
MPIPWFSVATHFRGITEVHGSVDNPKILEMFRISGHPEIKDDETPWCAAFVGACLRLAGYRSSGSLGARSYQRFGDDLGSKPQRGCIVVFWRGDPNAATGHVAFFDREEGDRVFVLGGNQGDAVSIDPYPKSRVLAYRWPTETAPLPTDTTLPNILTIDPANAPAHLISIGAGSSAGVDTGSRSARATEELAEGSIGPEVRALQEALTRRGFQVGPIDGEFGPLTRAAVVSFQTVQGLPATGSADESTLRALGIAQPITPPVPTPSEPHLPASINQGPTAMQPQDILKILFDALIPKQAPAAQPPATNPATALNTSQLLQVVLAALAGTKPPAQPAMPGESPATPSTTTPPVLSPIDNMLGGQMLAGKKTALAILAYVVMAILQAVGVAGTATGATATPTGQILTTLIAAFGGLGLLGKIDRGTQMLGLIAGKPATPPK